MPLSVVLVRPMYPMNIGYVARVMHNFGCADLKVVDAKIPRSNSEARSRAMHGLPVLENAVQYDSLPKALNGFDAVFGTSAKISGPNKLSRSALDPAEWAAACARTKASVALVLGNEQTGLTNEELKECDALIHIQTHSRYRSLSLSHAAAVLLHAYFTTPPRRPLKKVMTPATRERLEKATEAFIASLPGLQQPDSAQKVFRSLWARTLPTEKEGKMLLAVFSNAAKNLRKNTTHK